jgi:low affinity Fe/Cu permease
MARSVSKAEVDAAATRQHPARASNNHAGGNTWSGLFSRMSGVVAHWAGKPGAFLTAAVLVILWAITGPLFGFSDTWQLVINTSTTIVTFLMVFLIQNTQNRDTLALQLKLSELILVIREAENRFAIAEDLSEEELEQLHQELEQRVQTTRGALDRRRAERTRKAS